mgnify:CR=1 FL=1
MVWCVFQYSWSTAWKKSWVVVITQAIAVEPVPSTSKASRSVRGRVMRIACEIFALTVSENWPRFILFQNQPGTLSLSVMFDGVWAESRDPVIDFWCSVQTKKNAYGKHRKCIRTDFTQSFSTFLTQIRFSIISEENDFSIVRKLLAILQSPSVVL